MSQQVSRLCSTTAEEQYYTVSIRLTAEVLEALQHNPNEAYVQLFDNSCNLKVGDSTFTYNALSTPNTECWQSLPKSEDEENDYNTLVQMGSFHRKLMPSKRTPKQESSSKSKTKTRTDPKRRKSNEYSELRQQLINLLAPRKFTIDDINQHFSSYSAANLRSELREIARYTGASSYELHPKFYQDVQVDEVPKDLWPDLRKKALAAFQKLGTPSHAAVVKKFESIPVSNINGNANNNVDLSWVDIPHAPFPSLISDLDISSTQVKQEIYEPITSVEEYEEYCHIYHDKYKLYQEIDRRIDQNAKQFEDLGKTYERLEQLDKSAAGNANVRYYKAQVVQTLEKLYAKRFEEVDKLNALYATLHKELSQIRDRVDDFIAEWSR